MSWEAPDTDFVGYPTGWISGAGRILDIRLDINSTFKCPVKYELNKDIRCTYIEGFLFPYLNSI
jgi:hypothetical protein